MNSQIINTHYLTCFQVNALKEKKMKNYFLLFLVALSFSAIQAQPPGFEWIKKYGTPLQDAVHAISEDSEGNIYLAAGFSDTITLESETLISNGGTDALLIKCNSNGDILWFTSIGGTADDMGTEVTIDPEGNVIFSGVFHSHEVFIGDTILYSCGCWEFSFTSKYSSTGELQWVHSVLGEGAVITNGQAVNSEGDIYVTGVFYMQSYFGSDTVVTAGSADIFLAMYSQSGILQWVKTFGYSGYDYGADITLDNNEMPVLTGYFEKKVTFGNDTLASSGYYDTYIVKTDADGNPLWAKKAGGENEDQGIGICVDAQNKIYITGFYSGTTWFEDYSFESVGNYDSYLARYDENGYFENAVVFGGTDHEMGTKVSVDQTGNIYACGQFSGSVTFADTLLTSTNYLDSYLIKLDSDWNRVWIKQAGGLNQQKITDIAVTGNDSLYICITFSDSVFIDGDTIPGYGGGWDDFMVGRILPDSLLTQTMLFTNEDFLIYPNPVTDRLQLVTNSESFVRIIETSGRTIYTRRFESTHTIDCSGFEKGIYFVEVTTRKSKKISKIVKY
ncbi:MAG: hypothetical protein A2W91_06465 [Bacteroidetes bacterium GWF2_38_335]|nr:MAG: hypothetical protein A2W91_06465 [Bacteroidetes bacterium GWF2_38_335]OFY77676.1 MAG: hypothetical protein A2281_17980 [Bacteroidetes bacterium RIFOXYA12_FULL_38_20]HBS89095.1 hypothetical protein [Bacteroidales bacterium]